jgi:hypothetical protein
MTWRGRGVDGAAGDDPVGPAGRLTGPEVAVPVLLVPGRS